MEDLLTDVYDPPALTNIGSRIGAAFADFALLVILFVGFVHFWGVNEVSSTEVHFQLSGLPGLAWFAISFGLMPLQEGLTGKTLGKRLMGIRVVRKDYSDAGVGGSVARHLFDVVDCFFLVGLIVASRSPLRQRVGDLVGNTIVVKG